MSERKHPATPRRKQEARKKGQVFKSQELVSSVMLLGLLFLLKYWLPTMLLKVESVFYFIFEKQGEWTLVTVNNIMTNLTWMVVMIMWPIFLVGTGLAVSGNYLQVGSLLTLEPLKPQLSRISIINGAKRLFGPKAWVELVKSIIKVLIIGYFLYAAVSDNIETFSGLQQVSVIQGAVFLGQIVFNLAIKIAIIFVVLAVGDYFFQWWEYQKSLRMTQEELKQEYKQTEGSPELKSAIKKRQRAISMRRMMQDLKKADAVITNPTHYAVALEYDVKKHSAPNVIAKGQDELALRIRELAKEYGIVVMENKPLARALYDQVEIGQAVPPELYKAVAEVLAFVYRLKKKKMKL